jgi:hypothetical protein
MVQQNNIPVQDSTFIFTEGVRDRIIRIPRASPLDLYIN